MRQRLIDHTPVVETSMRVPGGDAVHRTYAVKAGGDLTVIEVENRSPVPFALALVVGPPAGRIQLGNDGRAIEVDGRVAIDLPARPQRLAGSTLGPEEVERIVTSGAAGTDFSPVRSRRRHAAGAFLFPLAHTATLRVAIRSLGADPVHLSRLPSAAAAAAGWVALGRHGMRVDLPPGLLAHAYEANGRILRLLDPPPPSPPPPAHRALVRARELLAAVSPTFIWPDDLDGRTASEFVACVQAVLVSEEEGTVAVCSALPEEWIGQNFEVHEVPTRTGYISYAVRWHGERPALLWEFGPPGQWGKTVEIVAPGLDPSFRSADPRGEVLLGGGFHPPVTSTGA